MVITVTCPACSSAFPVDPAKIPERGVNVRCSQCSNIFRVERPTEPEPEPMMELPEITPLPEVSAPSGTQDAPEPVTDDWSIETEEAPPRLTSELPGPMDGQDPFERPAPFEDPAPSPSYEAPGEESLPADEAPVQAFTFGKRDPTDKAKRLARVLVSDMIMYNAERHQSALAAGTLVQDFEEEIEKSWKEFVDQVGDEIANGPGRGFWTEALNDILARGEKVF